MQADWYYIENDQTVGPTTLEDLARRIGQTGEIRFVWNQGMAEWTEAEAVPALSRLVRLASPPFAAALQRSNEPEPVILEKTSLVYRLRKELSEYLLISLYLFICFSAFVFYKAAIMHNDGVEFEHFGIAIVKALIVAKFVLILHTLKIGEEKDGGRALLAVILKKSVLFLLFIIVLTVIEEIVVGLVHRRAVGEAISEIGGGTLQQAFSVSILMLLILIPYFTFRLVGDRLGEGVLWKLLTKRAAVASS
jgi:GYF domain 2